jgi:PQQ-dependent dehydrogenase (s-GDH family)
VTSRRETIPFTRRWRSTLLVVLTRRQVAGSAVACVLAATVLGLAQGGPDSVRPATKRFDMRVVTSGLESPWEVALGPDGMLWVTERSALRITRVDPQTGERKVAASLGTMARAVGPGGVLGMALHPRLLQEGGPDFVYVAVTYEDLARPADARVTATDSPFRHLHAKVVRLRYERASEALVEPVTILDGLPAGNDHIGLRLAFAPDGTLHLTTGDQGNGQFGNFCNPILSQRLPTAAEVEAGDWSAYEGKTLRMTLDGGIPPDNPTLDGVRSHVYTYGHRNPQGITVGADGQLYTSDHGPKTDDEVNVLRAGGNYGWPHVAGLRDDMAYQYARWYDASVPCRSLEFSDLVVPASVPTHDETSFVPALTAPLATLFTVPTGYDFADPACGGVHSICWPTVGASSIEWYEGGAIPGWDRVLIVSTLKRGSLYVVPVDASGQRAAGPISREARTENRYRDTAVSADGRTIYVATDGGGLVEALGGGVSRTLSHPGSILAFTHAGEAPVTPTAAAAGGPSGRVTSAAPAPSATPPRPSPPRAASAAPPPFTRAQALGGKAAYDASCAVCHGTTLVNGAYGTPLAGPYFRQQWSGRSVADLFEKTRTTMPPTGAGTLPVTTYAAIVAYMLEANGSVPGETELPVDVGRLQQWIVP